MRMIDWPPVWLGIFVALTWGLAQVPLLPEPIPVLAALAEMLVAAGLAVMAIAAGQMVWRKTTVVPRRDPSALVTGGIFALSRNPIYLGDALVLGGVILWLQAALALPLLPLFVFVITRRFILGEEARLRAAFGPAFDAYCRRTRRWL